MHEKKKNSGTHKRSCSVVVVTVLACARFFLLFARSRHRYLVPSRGERHHCGSGTELTGAHEESNVRKSRVTFL